MLAKWSTPPLIFWSKLRLCEIVFFRLLFALLMSGSFTKIPRDIDPSTLVQQVPGWFWMARRVKDFALWRLIQSTFGKSTEAPWNIEIWSWLWSIRWALAQQLATLGTWWLLQPKLAPYRGTCMVMICKESGMLICFPSDGSVFNSFLCDKVLYCVAGWFPPQILYNAWWRHKMILGDSN